MRKIKIFFGFLIALAMGSCTDFVDPAIPYGDFQTGVYLRTLSVTPNFEFNTLASSSFSVMVEAVDIEDGGLVSEVTVFVKQRRANTLSPEVEVKTVPASAFQRHSIILPNVHPASGSKFPAATIEVSVTEALQAMGKTVADITGGDFFEFRLELLTTDGRVFTNSNLSQDLQTGGYYRSPFFYRVPVVCTSDLAGEYIATTTGTSTDACCPTAVTLTDQTVTLTAINDTDYAVSDFTAGLYRAFYEVYGISAEYVAAGNLRKTISDACGNINGSFGEPFGTNVTVTGSVNLTTGVITYTWINGYDDTGVVTLTPK